MEERRMVENREPAGISGPLKQREASPCFSVDFYGGRVISLNYDVLMEILVRLPLKSVTRLKLVCKSWLSFISTDQFCRLYTLRCHKPPSSRIITVSYPRKRRELFYSNPIIKRIVINDSKILSCSNGLMLLQRKDRCDYYVYNPTTNQSKKLSLSHNAKYCNISLHLVFDPSKSLHYKIVCVWPNFSKHRIEVFDSESGTWRVCVKLVTTNAGMETPADCVHYKSLIFLIYRATYNSGCVYCFDIVKNVSQLIACPLPERAEALAYSHSLQESSGSLYYCALLRDGLDKSSAALWKLQVNEDDPRRSDWWLEYDHRDHCLPHRSGFNLLTFIAETSTVLIYVPNMIVAYNFIDKSYDELLDLKPDISSVKVHHFGETLALL